MEEIGHDGVNRLRETLKFGDIVVNHLASENNPHRKGVFVMYKGKDIHVTNMKGSFWTPILAADSKIEVIGNILQPVDNWREEARTYAEYTMTAEGCFGRSDPMNVSKFYGYMLEFIQNTYTLNLKIK